MQISEARNRYVSWLLAGRDLSPHTIRAYEGDLRSFERHLGPRARAAGVDRDCVVSFVEEQRASGLSPASVKRRASALRGFCRWLLSQGVLEADPWSGANLAFDRSRRLPRALPAHQLESLIAFLERATGIRRGERPDPGPIAARPHETTTLLAVTLMVATGVRVNEAASIRSRDVDLPGGAIRLLGKGRRERRVFLPNEWIAALTGAYQEARAALGVAHPFLLFNLRLDPLTPPALRSRLSKAATAAGLPAVTPHMLRHTAATQLIEAGVDIRYIQRLLGHASLSTTEIYTHVSDPALQRVVSDADVLGRLAQGR